MSNIGLSYKEKYENSQKYMVYDFYFVKMRGGMSLKFLTAISAIDHCELE